MIKGYKNDPPNWNWNQKNRLDSEVWKRIWIRNRKVEMSLKMSRLFFFKLFDWKLQSMAETCFCFNDNYPFHADKICLNFVCQKKTNIVNKFSLGDCPLLKCIENFFGSVIYHSLEKRQNNEFFSHMGKWER